MRGELMWMAGGFYKRFRDIYGAVMPLFFPMYIVMRRLVAGTPDSDMYSRMRGFDQILHIFL